MSRALLTINGSADRERAIRLIGTVPPGTRVEVKASKRSTDQNSKLWAMLSDVAYQLSWHGTKLRADDWKFLFLDALKREVRAVPNIDGTGFVNIGRSSSDLSKQEFGDLLELIHAFGANHGVTFHDSLQVAPTLVADDPPAESSSPARSAGGYSLERA